VRTWWLGDLSGALVTVPFALAWYRRPSGPLSRRRLVEAAALVASSIALSAVSLRSGRPLVYLMFPALIWGALRFGQRGATLAVAVVVGLTVWSTTHYTGPFVFDSVTRSVLNVQLFIAVSALSTLCLAAVVAEREQVSRSLRASRARLVEAAETERRRLEHNLHDGAQQRLVALAFRLHEVKVNIGGSPQRVEALVRAAEDDLDRAIEELRDFAHGINPPILTNFGIARAIQDIAARSPIPIELADAPTGRFDPVAEATVYYVVAESVTNAQRHANASSIRVRVTFAANALRAEIVDDGVGGADESRGSGLQGLRDRVEAVGGTFEVTSSAGRGTRIDAVVPASS
jgi:signal transduction histidine kinase